jgi:hypothetical protein
MTTTTDTPAATVITGGGVNARAEQTFLWGSGFELTARQIVYCLAAHLALFGDTLDPKIVDPLAAIDAHMRFDGDLTGWTTGRTPAAVSVLLTRAEQIARDYFGHHFPAVPW